MPGPTDPTPLGPRAESSPLPSCPPAVRNARSELKARAGVVALHVGLIALVWFLGFLPDVLAAGLAVIAVVSGVVPDRWSAITAGVLLLVGAGLIYINYSLSGDRRLALVAAILGIVFVGYGAMRMRSRGSP